jgi:hypothetical protein
MMPYLVKEVTQYGETGTDDCAMAQWFLEYRIDQLRREVEAAVGARPPRSPSRRGSDAADSGESYERQRGRRFHKSSRGARLRMGGGGAALAVVLLKTIEPDGTVGLSVVPSEGCDWVNRVGLLQAALNSELRDLIGEK